MLPLKLPASFRCLATLILQAKGCVSNPDPVIVYIFHKPEQAVTMHQQHSVAASCVMHCVDCLPALLLRCCARLQ